MNTLAKGYTARRLGLISRVNEMTLLFTEYRRGREQRVRKSIAEIGAALAEIKTILGKPVSNMDVLEIGSGQQSLQLAVMSAKNRAVGIDQESTGDELNVKSIVHTVKTDGFIRAVKTVARKGIGFDRAIRAEYVKQAGVNSWPSLNIQKMDAECMSFPDNSFDVIFSSAVFEHIANPARVLHEVARVLRPGGVFLCRLHLYTSDSGCHDTRIFSNHRSMLPLWSHLREPHRGKVVENTYLNRLRLADWRHIFESNLPGVRVEPMMDDSTPERKFDLAKIRSQGELAEYSDEELLSVTVKAVWKRENPSSVSSKG
jgi:SAM-dependent methyltransferase